MKRSLENILGTSLKDELMKFIESNPDQYEELIKLSILNKEPHSSRAAWLLSKNIVKNDKRITRHIPELIKSLKIVKDGHQRDLISVLSRLELNEEQEGVLFDICVERWINLKKIPSLRYNAFKLILQIAKKYPELRREVFLLSEDYYLDSLSNGIKSSIQKLVTTFNEENNLT